LKKKNKHKKNRTKIIAPPTILLVKKITNTKPNIIKISFKQLNVRFTIVGMPTAKSILRIKEVGVFSKKNM
jgi:hypothetical protein